MSLINFLVFESYKIKTTDKLKTKKLNPKTNRIKIFRTNKYIETQIPPEERTFKNKPDNVRFQDWLLIKIEDSNSFGKSEADNKWYGWSHRAVAGFKVGDVVKIDTCGNIKPGKDWIIKTEEEARQQAISFAKDVS